MFKGFSPETFDFLWGIRFNNNRPWFQEHKQEYTDHLYAPMKALADQVDAGFHLEGTVTKTSRIYRDVRYSDVPYKDYLWFVLRQDNTFWSEHPSLYFQVEPEGASYGFINYAPKAQIMSLHRQALLENPEKVMGLFDSMAALQGFEDKSTRYKRPKPDSTPEISRWYDLKNCFFVQEIPVGEELFTPELPQRLIAGFEALRPLYDYFRSLEEKAALIESLKI